MSTTMTIARRQFASYFNGATAYFVIGIILTFLGYFFWSRFFLMQRASARVLFDLMPAALFIGAPALTMGLLAQEKRTGTIELLITMPVKDWEVIVGKYLGVLGLYGVLLLLTLPYPICVATLGDLAWGQVASGYFGLFLNGGAMLALGVAASSYTEEQIVAFMVALVLFFAAWFLDNLLPFLPFASVFEWLSFTYHYDAMTRGVIDLRDVVFFLTVIAFSLGIAFRSLESRRWK